MCKLYTLYSRIKMAVAMVFDVKGKIIDACMFLKGKPIFSGSFKVVQVAYAEK